MWSGGRVVGWSQKKSALLKKAAQTLYLSLRRFRTTMQE